MPEPEQPVEPSGAPRIAPEMPEAVKPPVEPPDQLAPTDGLLADSVAADSVAADRPVIDGPVIDWPVADSVAADGPEADGSMTGGTSPVDDDGTPGVGPGQDPDLDDGQAQRPRGDLVELLVAEVRAAVPLRPGQEAGLAVLAEAMEPFRSLHIYIGQPEARAIQAGRRGDSPSRPGTWDLLLAAVDALGGHLERAVIERVEEARHFYASIEISSPEGVKRLECRPSDAIALVVRVPSAGLYTTEEVVQSAGNYP